MQPQPQPVIDGVKFEQSSISKHFGGEKDVVAVYARVVLTENQRPEHFYGELVLEEEGEMIKRAEETFIIDPDEDEETIRLGTGFGTLNWNPDDDAPIEIVLYDYNNDKTEIWRKDITEKVQNVYEDLEEKQLHNSDQVKARLDDLHARVTDIEENDLDDRVTSLEDQLSE